MDSYEDFVDFLFSLKVEQPEIATMTIIIALFESETVEYDVSAHIQWVQSAM